MEYILELNGIYLYDGKKVILEWFDEKHVWIRMDNNLVDLPVATFTAQAKNVTEQ